MSGHYCSVHKTPFFMTGKMRGYAHPIKDAQGNTIKDGKGKDCWCNEEESNEATPPQASQQTAAPYSPPETDKRQTSIETQNAVTNVCNLWAAGKIDDDSLLVQNLIPYLESKLLPGSHRAQTASPMVQAVVEKGGVVAGPDIDAAQELSLTLDTAGKLRLALVKLGLNTQEQQLRAIGVADFDAAKAVEGGIPRAYMTAWESVNGG